MGFNFNGLDSSTMISSLAKYQTKNYIPLVIYPTGKNVNDSSLRENVLSAINSILKLQLKLDGNVLSAIYYLIDELTNNVADHSCSNNGILFAQYYPSKNYLDVCITDNGRGIKKTYIDSGKASPKSDEEAIGLAVNGASTKDQAISRGFGLSTSRAMLANGLNGKFFLFSGNSFFYQNSQDKQIIVLPDNQSFKGCFIALRIPTLVNGNFDLYKYVR